MGRAAQESAVAEASSDAKGHDQQCLFLSLAAPGNLRLTRPAVAANPPPAASFAMIKARVDFDGALTALRELGVLLETDRAFPSLVALMAGAPVKGTWWAHPLANDIYMMGQRLMDHSEVLFIKLLSGKTTYLHRRLWPQLVAIAVAREPWQLAALPSTANSMLKRLDSRASLRMDEVRSSRSAKELGADARVLESRLLVFGDDVHTSSWRSCKTSRDVAALGATDRICDDEPAAARAGAAQP